MPGIWSRKFDYKNGEDRVCKLCGETFHTIKPRYRCNTCVNAKQKIVETARRAKYEKKAQYPFSTKTTEAANRLCSIRTKMSKAWREFEKTGDRSIVTQHYNNQLKEIEENGIMKWILDRRTNEAKTEGKLKSANMTRKEYPDTRGHHEE